MARTLIVIDPMGFNLTSLGMQYVLLRGTLFQLGDTVYRLPYTNQAGISNINGGVTALNNKLNSTSGDILVFGYSEGAQVATKWLRQYGKTSPVTPTSRLRFLLIGNAERRYGGFAYKHQNLADICDVDGLPDPLSDGTSTVHYQVTDFARQYDGFADFPSATDIQQAVDSVGAALSDPLNWALRALQDVTNAVIGAHKDAAVNAVLGMQMVHTNYFTVTPDDQHNVRFTDPDHPLVEYVWAPTYPVPLLGIGSTFPSLDRDKRKAIETAYSRPVALPQPNYPQISMFTTDFFGSDEDYRRVEETGWFPEPTPPTLRFVLSLTADLSMGSVARRGMQLGLTAHLSMSAVGHAGTFTATFGLALTPALSVTGSPKVQAAFGLSLSSGMGMSATGRSVAAFGLSLHPELTPSAAEHYVRGFALALSSAMSMVGEGRSLASFGLSMSAGMSMQGQAHASASFGLSLTPGVVMTPNLRSSFTLNVTPALSISGGAVYTRSFGLSLTPSISMDAAGTSAADFALSLASDMSMLAEGHGGTFDRGLSLSLTPALSVVAAGKSVAAFGLSATPGLTVAATGHGGSFDRSLSLSLTPTLSMSAVGHGGSFTRTLGLSLTASLSMVGTGHDGAPPGALYALNGYPGYNVVKWDGSTLTTVVSGLPGQPAGLTCDTLGNLYIGDFSGGQVVKWDGSTLTTVVSGLTKPSALAFDAAGDLYIGEYTTGAIVRKWNGSTLSVVLDLDRGLKSLTGLAFNAAGDLYIASRAGNTIQKWDGSTLTTVLVFSEAEYPHGYPGGLTFDAADDLNFGEFYAGDVVKWDGSTRTTVIPSGLTNVSGLAFGS